MQTHHPPHAVLAGDEVIGASLNEHYPNHIGDSPMWFGSHQMLLCICHAPQFPTLFARILCQFVIEGGALDGVLAGVLDGGLAGAASSSGGLTSI